MKMPSGRSFFIFAAGLVCGGALMAAENHFDVISDLTSTLNVKAERDAASVSEDLRAAYPNLPETILLGMDEKGQKPATPEGRRAILRKQTEEAFGESMQLLRRLTNGGFTSEYRMHQEIDGKRIALATNLRTDDNSTYVIRVSLNKATSKAEFVLVPYDDKNHELTKPDEIVRYLTEILHYRGMIDAAQLNAIGATKPTPAPSAAPFLKSAP